ncbi:ABC transporter permease [Streptomyces sp. NPDC046977]|uniref:ABC transporter permease n=1 Tax=Streptomyces sp. NPDC046977 TaxID=3154703 RepID=UPI0034048991
MSTLLRPARMRPRDVVRVGSVGLRTRPLRAFLSALGIAIGIAAMVAVVAISASSRAGLDRMLAQLGTNLLTVQPGQGLEGQQSSLPEQAVGMIGRIGPVTGVSAVGRIEGAKVYRSDKVPPQESGGLALYAARTDLPGTVGATVRSGTWLNAATSRYPAAVLGSVAARRLGLAAPDAGIQIFVAGSRYSVIGILDPVTLAPELDTAVLVGWPDAQQRLGFDGHPTTVYTRALDDQVEAVRNVLARTANPENPFEVSVSRPSDALAAKEAGDRTFGALLLALGAVALLVGGVGVANTMVISVLERRSEIGLRRALGATRGQIRLQFLSESLLLSGLGGGGGILLGAAATSGFAVSQHWPSVIPLWTLAAAFAATQVIGGLAGLYPAVRASRLSPTEALSST